jgi:hypothetical protein
VKKRVVQDAAGFWWCHYGTRRFRGVVRTCQNCNEEFVAPKHSKGLYCTNRCSAQARPKKGRTFENGYVVVDVLMDRNHPFAEVMGRKRKGRNSYQVLEHRLVMAEAISRPLTADETVHHINGDTRDNRLENLELRQGKHGKGVAHVCLECGSHNVAAVPLHQEETAEKR